MNDRADGKYDVRRIVNDCRRVARPDAKRGLARRICRFHHAGAARRKDNVGFFHNKVCHFKRRHVNPADDVLGRAGFYRCVKDDLCRGNRAFLCAGVRTDDNAVSRFQRNQRFENRGRSGVRRGDNRSDKSDGFGNLFDAVRLVFFDDAAGFHVAIRVVNIFRRVMVFDDLVFDNAHTRFFNRHSGKGYTHFVCCGRRGKKDFIDLLFRISREFPLRFADDGDFFDERVDAIDYFYVVFHLKLSRTYLFYILSATSASV